MWGFGDVGGFDHVTFVTYFELSIIPNSLFPVIDGAYLRTDLFFVSEQAFHVLIHFLSADFASRFRYRSEHCISVLHFYLTVNDVR